MVYDCRSGNYFKAWRFLNVVRFENVGMRYGMGPEVLQDVTFEVQPGEFRYLVGPSGAGKTSLLRLMYLAHRPSRGLISIFGADVIAAGRQQKIAVDAILEARHGAHRDAALNVGSEAHPDLVTAAHGGM